MMTCREAEARRALYIDNELAPSEAEDLERNLEACAKCHEAFEALRDVSDNIRAARASLQHAPRKRGARSRDDSGTEPRSDG